MIDPHLSFAAYCALDAAHFSTLKAMAQSPRAYRHACDHPRADTSALALGRALHSMTLTPDAPDVAVWRGGQRRGQEWAAFVDENAGKTILRAADLVTVEAMRASIVAHPVARELLSAGQPEVTVTWTQGGVACKARVDWVRPNGGIVELKTTRAAGEAQFAAAFARYAYHAQAALYFDGWCHHHESILMPSPMVIAVEKSPPHDVCVYRVADDVLEVGRRMIDTWIAAVATCTRTGEWPGAIPATVVDLVLPDWALSDGINDVDMDGIEEVTDVEQ